MNIDMEDDIFTQNIIDTYFEDNPSIFVSHHLDSYNDFYNNGIKRIIKEKNPITIIKEQDDKELRCYVYIGGKDGDKLYFGKPIIYDERKEHFMYPNEARLRNMTYGMTIHYDVHIEYFIRSIGGGDDTEQKIDVDMKAVADADADADVEDKKKPNYTKTYEKIFLGRFPIMLMSDHCILKGLSSPVKFELGECKNDYGGYFIIDGKEKCIVSQEKFADNMIYVKNKVDDTYSHSVDIRSVSEDASKPIRTLSIRIVSPSSKYTNNQIVVNVPNVRKPVPLFILMRALGVESDKDIIKYCLLDLDKHKSYVDLFIPSIHDATNIFTQDLAIDFIATFTKGKTVTHAIEILTNYLLPHIGEMNFKDKAYFIGHMVKELLIVFTGDVKPTDRDNFRFKRVELPGSLIYDLFREYYTIQQKNIFLKIDKKYHFNQNTFAGEKFFNLVDIFNDNPFVDRIVDEGFRKAFKGNWGAESHTKRLGVVQDLNRLSYNAALSHLRKLNLPLDSSAKVVGPRLLHSSQWGIIDPVDTPDGGNIGLHKHMSISASITSGISSTKIINWIIKNIDMTRLSENTPDVFSNMAKVFVNGNWIGSVYEPDKVERYMKTMRRIAVIPAYVSINWNIQDNIIYIYTDAGRLCRPIFYIENGVPSFDRDVIYEKILDKKNENNKDNIGDINDNDSKNKSKKMSWNNLLSGFAKKKDESFSIENQNVYDSWKELYDANRLEDILASKAVIEYVDTSESGSALIAMDNKMMRLKPKPYTHIEIHPSFIMGTMGNQIVFPENNPYPRNAFACGQMRQAISLYHTNHQTRIDKMGVVLNYGQVPLVKSRYLEKINNEQNPYGENVIVAIMSFNGYNVEDSILFNEGSVKRGLFRMTYYNMYEAHEETNNVGGSKLDAHFLNFEKETIERLKVGYDYSHLDEFGLIKENTKLDDKKVLIGRGIASNEKHNGERVYIDSSVFPKKGQLGYVEKSFMTEGDKGYRLAKVKVRDERYPYIGDKFCSRCGQKGTVGLIIPEEDMPFNAQGIRPDIIINPHAIPSRMTIGQLIETVVGKACSVYGGFGDCTAYSNKGSKIKVFGEMLTKAGLHSSGNEVLYNGQTGESFETEIFMGPTYYMRLKHMVKDKINYRARGPRTNLTRQTVQGRANDGGLRIGEMERDGVLAHGASVFLQESLMVRGDDYYMAVCNKTGMIAIYNENKNIFLSPLADGPLKFNDNDKMGTMNIENVSKHGRSFSVIRVPYAFKLLVQELQTINIQIRVITDDNIDQLSSMSFSNNIIKLKSEEDILLKTKKTLSDGNKLSVDDYSTYKQKLFGDYIQNVDDFIIDETSPNLFTTTQNISKNMTMKIMEAIIAEFDDNDVEEDDMSIIRRMNIVDVNAGMGINSMSFMKYFGHVDMIEEDGRMINILKHNIDLYSNKNNIKLDKYQIYQGKYKDVIVSENIKKDVIYFEPKDVVADDASSDLFINDIKIEDVVSGALQSFPFVIVKIPINKGVMIVKDENTREDVRPIFMMNFSKSKVLVYHNNDLLKNTIDTKLKKRENIQINTNARMNAEKLGWYLYNNMENGIVFGSIILDEDGKESDKWVVDDHDGRYPNVPVKGWKDSDLIYDDGTGKPIPSSLVIKRLRENFKETNKNTWDTVVKMIKSGTDYTPTTPSEDENSIKRLPNEQLPSISDNYIPFTPNNGVSPIAEADFKLAKSSGADILQTVSKQLSDVQNTIANKAQSVAQNTAQNAMSAAQNAATVAQNTAQNMATVAQNTAQNVATVAQNAAQNTVTNVSKVADNVGNAIMDFVEGSKPSSSSTTETKTNGDVKKIVL
jgi:DNA-directed RNA polymerase II subunit RPB2